MNFTTNFQVNGKVTGKVTFWDLEARAGVIHSEGIGNDKLFLLSLIKIWPFELCGL